MKIFSAAIRNLCVVFACVSLPAWGSEPSTVQDLGEGLLQVGNVRVDTNARAFTIAGQVLTHEDAGTPMEFIATTKNGMKSYESVLELETTALDFNLASILIGLDESNAKRPSFHFDPAAVTGDLVEITVTFVVDGKTRSVPVQDLVRADREMVHDWVYTGSAFGPGGRYLAEEAGTLIGFVHDPESVLQHRIGMGLGDYGGVTINTSVVPPGGTPVTVTVKRR